MVDPESFGVECTQTIHYLSTMICPEVSDVKQPNQIKFASLDEIESSAIQKSIQAPAHSLMPSKG